MNRTTYLEQVRASLEQFHPEAYESRIEYHDTDGQGMAVAINTAWDICLDTPWDYLLSVEEDMLLLAPLPIDEAVAALETNQHLSQMVFKREPWHHPIEQELGDVLAAILQLATWTHNHDTYWAHNHIFSLNPCLIPRRIVEMGWPTGNETGMTNQIHDATMIFGMWGQPGDPALVRHIGHNRAPGWQL